MDAGRQTATIIAPPTIILREKMKLPSTLLCLAVMLSASGCSLLYEIGQDANTDRCSRMQLIEDRNACLQRIGPHFEQYERDREKLKRGASERS
jgi:hypothetical protein